MIASNRPVLLLLFVLGQISFSTHSQAATVAELEKSKYRAGLFIAQKKGLSGQAAQCQARIFVKHAEPDTGKGPDPWTAGGPKYFGELRRICGVTAPPTIPGPPRSVEQTKMTAGLRLAAARGYTGSKASCYANVFVRHAALDNTGRGYVAPVSPAYVGELFSECGVSR
jgi:hypothetical protein